jgi:hypothetical protein
LTDIFNISVKLWIFFYKIYQTVQYDTWAAITNQKLKSYNNEKYLPVKITVPRDTVNYYQVSHCHSSTLNSVRYNAFQCYILFLMSVLWLIWNIRSFRCIHKIAKKQLFTSSCLFDCRYGTVCLTLDTFSWNFMFENFSKIYQEIQISLKPDKNNGTLHETVS